LYTESERGAQKRSLASTADTTSGELSRYVSYVVDSGEGTVERFVTLDASDGCTSISLIG